MTSPQLFVMELQFQLLFEIILYIEPFVLSLVIGTPAIVR